MPTDIKWEYMRLIAEDGRELYLRHDQSKIQSLQDQISSLSSGIPGLTGIGKGEQLMLSAGRWGKPDATKGELLVALNYGGDLQLQESSSTAGKWRPSVYSPGGSSSSDWEGIISL